MSPAWDVVLVRPKEDGNVGAVARLAKNFGADRLLLVAPRAKVGAVARRRAMGGLDLLRARQRFARFDDAVATADLVVGSTDLSAGRSGAFLRRSVSPERLGDILRPVVGRVALVFGPEDDGLNRTELARCDLLVHVTTRRDSPTLNLSHAAAVVLYAAHRGRAGLDPESTPVPEELELNGREKELLIARLGELAQRTGYPRHKQRGLILLIRRVLGRATPTEAECRMILGFVKGVNRSLPKRHG